MTRTAFLGALVALTATQATAEEPICMSYADMVSTLGDEWAEREVAVGLDNRGVAVMLFLSEGGTFTVIYTTADRQSCIVAAGTDMMMVSPDAIKGEDG